MDIILALTKELNVEKWQIEAAVKLIDEGNTIPFISRYRKEVTGALNDEVLRNLNGRLTYLRKTDFRSADAGCGRGFISSIPSETSHQSNDCKRKRVGTSCKHYFITDDRQIP